MKHTELVDKFDHTIDSLEREYFDRGFSEKQLEPFFFQIRTQTFFFRRLDKLSIDPSLQDEIYEHYNDKQKSIELQISYLLYALKYGSLLKLAFEDVEYDSYELDYLEITFNSKDIAPIVLSLVEALSIISELVDDELAGKLLRFKDRLASASMDIVESTLKRVEKLLADSELL